MMTEKEESYWSWGRTIEDEEQNHCAGSSGTSHGGTMDARNLLRRFKNIGNYLRLLSDADVYGLCKLYPVTRGGGWLCPLHDHPLSFICVHRVAKSYCSNDSTFFSSFFLDILRTMGPRQIDQLYDEYSTRRKIVPSGKTVRLYKM